MSDSVDFEPRVNGQQILGGGYQGYTVLLVATIINATSPNSFTISTSDEQQLMLYVTPDLAQILTQHQANGDIVEAFEINGRVEQDNASITAISITPLFDANTDEKKQFDMKLYEKLVDYWGRNELLPMFFPTGQEGNE